MDNTISQDGKIYDLENLDLYEIEYRVVKKRLKLKNTTNGKFYDASNRYGSRIINEATDNNPEFLLFEGRDFPFFEPPNALRSRVYYVNKIKIDSSDLPALRELITPRLNHALRTGVTTKADVNIKFVFKDNNINPILFKF